LVDSCSIIAEAGRKAGRLRGGRSAAAISETQRGPTGQPSVSAPFCTNHLTAFRRSSRGASSHCRERDVLQAQWYMIRTGLPARSQDMPYGSSAPASVTTLPHRGHGSTRKSRSSTPAAIADSMQIPSSLIPKGFRVRIAPRRFRGRPAPERTAGVQKRYPTPAYPEWSVAVPESPDQLLYV